uniref:Pectinesterase inhibitor domain-containing protein n=1 Tax=Kalanchoe fedtschenkoi TaxID=63787 RepID=A0A7N0UCY7_KALFE
MRKLLHLLAAYALLIMAMAFTSAAFNWHDDIITQKVIRRTCKKTHLYSFCVKAVNHFPIQYRYTKPLDVAQTLVQLLGWQANSMVLGIDRLIESLIKYRHTSFIASLHACRDLYNKIYTVDYYIASDKLISGNFKLAEQRMLMAYRRAQSCEYAFRRIGKTPYVFLKKNSQTCRLALVAAGAAHSLY